jgi:hypothetical protein
MTTTMHKHNLAVSLVLASVLITTITITYATPENGYNNNTDQLPTVYEGTHIEGNYKAYIIINPEVTGTYATEGNYKIDITINPNPIGGSFKEGDYKLDLIPEKSFPDQYGISITDIVTSKTIVGQGYTVTINVTVTNQELTPATFSINIYADTTTVHTQTITLEGKASADITFAWITTTFAKGIYAMSAFAIPIPGETYTVDNTHPGGTVKVTIPCDANGDGIVDIRDLFSLGKAYASTPYTDNWNPNCDFNENKNVDNPDLADLSNYYGTNES